MLILDNVCSIPHYSNAHTILPKMEQNRQKKLMQNGGNLWAVEQSRIRKNREEWSRIWIGLVICIG